MTFLESIVYRSHLKSVKRPLPDPDNYYDGQTYIVLNRQSSIFRFNRNKSLGVFSPESPIRNFCISLFIHPMFSRYGSTDRLIGRTRSAGNISESIEKVYDVNSHCELWIYDIIEATSIC